MRDRPFSEYQAILAARRAALATELAATLAGRSSLTLEVGCGHGHFLTAYATAHPAEFCLGIDIASDRILRGQRKRDRAGLGNLAFVRADADDLLAALPHGSRMDAVFILFPDPWPKSRHHKNRVIRPDFLAALAQRCASGAALYFRTDYMPYWREAGEILASHPDWTLDAGASWPFEYTSVFQERAESHASLIARRVGKSERAPS